MDTIQIDTKACRGRQARLLQVIRDLKLDAAIVQQAEHVQWLAGPRYDWKFQPTVLLTADGHLVLVAPNRPPERAAADEVLTYEAQWHSTLRNDQRLASSQVLLKFIRQAGLTLTRVGVEYSCFSQHMVTNGASPVDIEPSLYQLRRRKDPDELALLRRAIAATGRMYQVARGMIRPGVTEIEVFNALQSAAVEECGEMLTGTGNDYRCGAPGGPPRESHPARDGELYILDLGPAFRGYFADNARTVAVGKPTEVQQEAWSYVIRALDHVRSHVKPGKSARVLFREAEEILARAPVGQFSHHLGHGIGLFPHEAPHLNPHWNDTFEIGDVFTAEPGLYAAELNAGIRIENDFLVTERGVEVLSDFPLEL